MAKTLEIQPPLVGYPRFVAFNRISIERVDIFVLMHFGLLGTSGGLLDSYSCAIPSLELELQRKSLMDYLGRSSSLGDPPPDWQAPATGRPIDLCNHIGLCGNPALGEITLNNFVGRAAAEIQGNRKTIAAQPVALLKSTMELQKHWINALFK
jgi:hypothetical protein